MHRIRVAIVGGGLGGLYAAWRLHQQGVHGWVLFEARERLGGRILGADAAGRAMAPGTAGAAGTDGADEADAIDRFDGFDLGPAWFWPEAQPQLDGVVQALGLQRLAQFDEGDTVVERSPQQAPVRMRGWRSAPASVRLQGGMGALVQALRSALPAGQVLTGHAVRRLAVEDGRIELHTTGDAAVWSAEHVLLALPPRLAVQAIAFAPGLPPALERAWRSTDTWMAPHAKYLAVYETPFWRAQGLSGQARSSCGPMVELHDASVPGGHAALFGFIGVPARVRRGVAEDVLRAHCRAQLGRLFGPQALVPQAEVLKDWALDAHTATEADLDSDGQHAQAPAAEPGDGPWQGRLTGIGSEWSPQFPGYLAGAVEAAEQGVQAWRARAAPEPVKPRP